MSPFADGTPQVSQWPIPAKHYFDYEMHPEPGSAGTYFYHSHVGFQAVSCAGPLIVEDQEEPPYDYDDDKIIFISDVFIKTNTMIEQGLIATPLNWSGETAMVLINGKGGGNNNGTFCNASLPIIDVDPGKTYRLRFIGSTALTFAHLEIEGHSMAVIEADGYLVSAPVPLTVLTSIVITQDQSIRASCRQVLANAIPHSFTQRKLHMQMALI